MPFCKVSTKAFSAVVIGSAVGVTRVQKTHALGFYVHVRWKPMGISDVYLNYQMIEQVNGHWEFNRRDHAFTFPGILETFQRHIKPSFAFDVVTGHELQSLQDTVCHVLFWRIGMHQWGFSVLL